MCPFGTIEIIPLGSVAVYFATLPVFIQNRKTPPSGTNPKAVFFIEKREKNESQYRQAVFTYQCKKGLCEFVEKYMDRL